MATPTICTGSAAAGPVNQPRFRSLTQVPSEPSVCLWYTCMSLWPSYMSSQNVAAWRRSGFGSATLGVDSGDLALVRTRVLLVGGADDEDRLYSDVWETDSLGNFKLLKSDAGWSPRTNMATTVHTLDGVEWLYVMAGFEWRMQDGVKTGAYLNDLVCGVSARGHAACQGVRSARDRRPSSV